MLNKKLYSYSFFMLLFIIIIYISLAPIGHWQDEYNVFNDMLSKKDGFFHRVIHWSPRPVSEFFVLLYGKAVGYSHSQMIPESLLVMWSILMAALVSPPLLYKRKFPSKITFIQIFIFFVSLFCIFLISSPATEFFYWPVASFAYIPVVAAVSLVFGSLVFSLNDEIYYQILLSLSLVTASLCSECGAIFSIIFSIYLWLYTITIAKGHIFCKKNIIWLLPFLSSSFVLYVLSKGRLGNSGEISNSLIAHHILPSVEHGIIRFLYEVIIPSNDIWGSGTIDFIGAIIAKTLFFCSAYLIFKPVFQNGNCRNSSMELLLFSLSCFSCVLTVQIASFYEFGMEGYARHITFRQCLIYIALASLAASFSANSSKKNYDNSRYPILFLLFSVLISFSWNVRGIVKEYKNYSIIYKTHKENWNSHLKNSDEIVFINPPFSPLTGELYLTPGIYNYGNIPDSVPNYWLMDGMLEYFKKDFLTVMNYKK